MTAELKKNVINMKTLSQDIDDPIVVNAADANGRTLEIIFTQEAAAQLTPDTKVYLSWYHQQQKIKGYNVFTYVPGDNPKRDPYRWKIFYPQSMLYCGDVLACIELVDDVSIAASTNFMIHVLEDPNDGSTFVVSDDFSEFKTAVIALSSLADQVSADFAEMQEQFQYILTVVDDTTLALNNIEDILTQIQEDVDNSIKPRLSTAEGEISNLGQRVETLEQNAADWTTVINQAKQEAIEKATQNSQVTVDRWYGGPGDTYSDWYIFYQNNQPIFKGEIVLEKQQIPSNGILIQPTPQNPIIIDDKEIVSGFYIKIIINNGEDFYIDITDAAEYGNMSWHSLSS